MPARRACVALAWRASRSAGSGAGRSAASTACRHAYRMIPFALSGAPARPRRRARRGAGGPATAVAWTISGRRRISSATPEGELVDIPSSGTVTFLFTDVEGSTLLVERLGPAWGATLDAHHDLLRAAIEGAGGQQVNTNGDAVFAVFARPPDAVAAAVAAQRALA